MSTDPSPSSAAVHAALTGRRTVHRYVPEPVDPAILSRALEAAHAAPCHKLTWPWRFTRVGRATREALVQVAIRLKSARSPLDADRCAALRRKMLDPAELVVVSQVLADDPFRRQEDYAATACAIQNLSLSLAAEGVGSKWSTGGVTRDPETYALLGIDPAAEQIVGFVWVGYAAKEPPVPPRPPLDTVVRAVD
jgi:nitroreductase